MKNVISLKVRILGSNLFLTREYVSHFDVKALALLNMSSCIFHCHYRLYFLSFGIKFGYTETFLTFKNY
jgi:hypothetical protein